MERRMDLKETIRSIPGWPMDGVIFRDLTTLMQNPEAFRESCDILYDRYKDMDIDKIVGIDARGFVFGAVLAYKLGIGFVPVRKKGKLPWKTIEETYSLEYGQGTLEASALSRFEKRGNSPGKPSRKPIALNMGREPLKFMRMPSNRVRISSLWMTSSPPAAPWPPR